MYHLSYVLHSSPLFALSLRLCSTPHTVKGRLKWSRDRNTGMCSSYSAPSAVLLMQVRFISPALKVFGTPQSPGCCLGELSNTGINTDTGELPARVSRACQHLEVPGTAVGLQSSLAQGAPQNSSIGGTAASRGRWQG